MEYVKGKPYFACAKRIKQYPYLDKDISCDVLIIGGGIDGAILNYYLSKKYKMALVDSSRFGMSATACATALLEYQLDDYADNLLKFMSEKDVVETYKMGLKSIEMIDKFIKEHGNHCHFRLSPSFMYTNSIFGIKKLKKEHKFRLRHGFQSTYYEDNTNPFPFRIKAGIYNPDGGAEFNPYLFAKQMIESADNQDMLFENTKVDRFYIKGGYFIAETNYGNKIKCKKIVLATGFNFSLMDEKNVCERVISFSIVTNKLDIKWKHNALIQDDLDPYHYLRILPDNRLIFGGEDVKFKNKPISDKLARKKYNKLVKDLQKMFPDKDIEAEYKFAGVFGSTDNNLGLIGETETPNLYYFLSAGANGIINAMYGATLIQDIFEDKPNALINLFSPMR